VQGLSAEARRILEEHSWPGNVRELRNVCEYAVIVCDGVLVEPRHLALAEPVQAPKPVEAAAPQNNATLALRDRTIRNMEVELIRVVLEETRFNIARAARELGINRSTLYNKMKDYGLCRDERRELKVSV
jgi:two-component system response regulator AtoC